MSKWAPGHDDGARADAAIDAPAPVTEASPAIAAQDAPVYTEDSLTMGPAEPTALEKLQADAITRALQLLGTRYRYGGGDPKSGFDCSGFVRYVFRDLLINDLPRASSAMAALPVPSIDTSNLQPGDLLFFKIRRGRVSHVAIYAGAGQFVHAPRGGGRVRVERMDERYWKARYAGAKRVLGETLPEPESLARNDAPAPIKHAPQAKPVVKKARPASGRPAPAKPAAAPTARDAAAHADSIEATP